MEHGKINLLGQAQQQQQLQHQHQQHFVQTQVEVPRDILLGATISCKPDRLRRRCSVVSAVSFDGLPPGDGDDVFCDEELISLKMKVAELETENEVQRSRARKSELLLATAREKNVALEKENARLKQDNQAADNLNKKLQHKILFLQRRKTQENGDSPPSNPTLSRSVDKPQATRRSSLIGMLRQSFMTVDEPADFGSDVLNNEPKKARDNLRRSLIKQSSCSSLNLIDEISAKPKKKDRRRSFSSLSFGDIDFDPAEDTNTDCGIEGEGGDKSSFIENFRSSIMSLRYEEVGEHAIDKEIGAETFNKKESYYRRRISSGFSDKSFKSENFSSSFSSDDDDDAQVGQNTPKRIRPKEEDAASVEHLLPIAKMSAGLCSTDSTEIGTSAQGSGDKIASLLLRRRSSIVGSEPDSL